MSNIITHLNAYVSILCPTWCARGHNHPADLTDLHGARRTHLHTRRIPGRCGRQEVTVRRADHVHLDGHVTSDTPVVVLNGADVLDIEAARELIAGLAHAVDLATGGAR